MTKLTLNRKYSGFGFEKPSFKIKDWRDHNTNKDEQRLMTLIENNEDVDQDVAVIEIAFEIMETVTKLQLPLQVKNVTPGKDNFVTSFFGHYLSYSSIVFKVMVTAL